MSSRFFPGKSVEWLKARYDEVCDAIIAGDLTSAGAGDVSSSRENKIGILQRKAWLENDLRILGVLTAETGAGKNDRTGFDFS